MKHSSSKVFNLIFIAFCTICMLSSCSKVPVISHFFPGSESASVSLLPSEIEYKAATVDTLYEELHNNILRAERTYLNEYVELSGELESIDSSGKYFLMISPDDNSIFSWSKKTIRCSITDEAQIDALLEKNIGDLITVHGQITKVKESSGYALNLIEFIETEASDG